MFVVSDESMDALFEEAFRGHESFQEKIEKIASRRVAVSTPTPDAKNEARVLVTQGEGSSEIRVHRGQTHQVYPYPLCNVRTLSNTNEMLYCYPSPRIYR